MANLALAFNLSASATGMAQGINAGVVELQKLGYAAKQTARDVSTLKTIEISRAFIAGISGIVSSISQAQAALSGFVNESVSIGEEASKANVIFGESAAAVQEFASSASSIGLSQRAALGATASFGNLFAAIGLTREESASMSVDLTRLASDLASFNNTSTEDAITALGAALRGEAEPIRRYGVLLDDASLRQTAFAAGLVRSVKDGLEPSVKAQAAFLAILKQTANAQGDFARTSDSLANQQRILGAEWDNIRATIGDSLQPAYRAFVSALRESLPQIKAAGLELASFIGEIDFGRVIDAAISGFNGFTSALSAVLVVAAPLADNLLPSIGAYLAFINRQAIAGGIAGLPRIFSAAASAAFGYTAAAGTAATATATLGASIRATLASTGIGVLVVGLGLLAGAALEWAVASKSAGAEVGAAVEQATVATKKQQQELKKAAVISADLGAEVAKALKVPEEISIREFAQGGIDAARSAIVSLAGELGGLDQVPAELVKQFTELQGLVRFVNREHQNEAQWLGVIDDRARALQEQIKKLAASRQADADAAKAQSEAAKRAAEESRKRVGELASQGLTPAEQNRVKLNQDLIDIGRERAAAEAALGEAMKARDGQAIAAAKERLRLAGEAVKVARNQDRDRQLQALGIDDNLLKPAKSIAQEFLNVRKAFDQKLIDGNEAGIALRNLAAEGVQIRQEIAAELARPAQRALQVSDVRTSEGFSQFLSTGRPDPALEQRREQLQKLNEIKQAIIATGAQPALILGAG
jgi:hypothetical protein